MEFLASAFRIGQPAHAIQDDSIEHPRHLNDDRQKNLFHNLEKIPKIAPASRPAPLSMHFSSVRATIELYKQYR